MPASFLVAGGDEIGDEIGDAIPRVLRPAVVRTVNEFLESLSRTELTHRYDAARMATLEIYPERIWSRDGEGEHSPREYLLDAYDDLRSFVRTTSERGQSLIVHLS
jgi:hypothetical protein